MVSGKLQIKKEINNTVKISVVAMNQLMAFLMISSAKTSMLPLINFIDRANGMAKGSDQIKWRGGTGSTIVRATPLFINGGPLIA